MIILYCYCFCSFNYIFDIKKSKSNIQKKDRKMSGEDRFLDSVKKELKELTTDKLVNTIEIKGETKYDITVEILTLENQSILIKCHEYGIQIEDIEGLHDTKEDLIFENFESFLGRFSPLYTSRF